MVNYINLDTACSKLPPHGMSLISKPWMRFLVTIPEFIKETGAITIQGSNRIFYAFPNDKEQLAEIVKKYKTEYKSKYKNV